MAANGETVRDVTEMLHAKRSLLLSGNEEAGNKKRKSSHRPDKLGAVDELVVDGPSSDQSSVLPCLADISLTRADSTKDNRSLTMPGTSITRRKDVARRGQDTKIDRAPTKPILTAAAYDACFGLVSGEAVVKMSRRKKDRKTCLCQKSLLTTTALH